MHFFQLLRITGIGLAGVALALGQPVLAKTKQPKTAPPTQEAQADAGVRVGEQIITDAVEICDLMVADKRALLARLEDNGWSKDISYDVGNAPYYKELTADQTYDGVGDAEVWGFIEDYPSYKIGYCSFTIPSPQIDVPVALVETIGGAFTLTGEIQKTDGGVFSTWQDVANPPSVFVHAYQNSDTFVYQVTRILAAPGNVPE
ncbi:hypothetical protein MNBD_ALPHA12-958 [hydrothermal vent metagenome]|uniref:Uncharacterized protein n=1 Tax=hydrothermal vent metagenome TaxID=652676 RepID=A0A3B0U6L7_9ZZZZ